MIENISKKFVWYPDSHQISKRLNLMKEKTCKHGRAVCYLECGVKLNMVTNEWTMVQSSRRLGWLTLMMEKELNQ